MSGSHVLSRSIVGAKFLGLRALVLTPKPYLLDEQKPNRDAKREASSLNAVVHATLLSGSRCTGYAAVANLQLSGASCQLTRWICTPVLDEQTVSEAIYTIAL